MGCEVGDGKRVEKLCCSNQGGQESLLTKGREKCPVGEGMQLSLVTWW